jgi:hypothetical protein
VLLFSPIVYPLIFTKLKSAEKNEFLFPLECLEREDVEWIFLAQDMDMWRPVVNTVMKYRVPQNARYLSG